MGNNIYSFIGITMKAGKISSGEFSCEASIKSGKAKLVIVAANASDNTRKNFSDMCSFYGVSIRFFGEKELLGRYIGKEKRAVIAIQDKNFSKRLMEMLDGCNEKTGVN